ncbi:hypothetical protein [Streptomyces canus]|uniref:hypothetical protein n=1 Tax=Streptomyces canus TaxID=58343 RepID=UPI002E31EC04|nr:hypothetical protein [Streptomyces canus]
MRRAGRNEVRDPAAVGSPNETVSQEEIEQALALIDRMTQDDLEGPEFTYTYGDALAEIMPFPGEVMSLCRCVS